MHKSFQIVNNEDRDVSTRRGETMRYFYVMLICISPGIHSYLYQGVVMRKWNDLDGRYHYFIGLGDYHNKQHPANQQQRDQLESLLAQTDSTDLKMLTEDLSVRNSDGRFSCGRFYVNSRGGFLGGITDSCRYLGIDTDNLEYRYARVCALGPLLNHSAKSPYSFASVRGISVDQLYSEVSTECDRINAFDDGPILNEWYKRCIQKVDKQLMAFGWSADDQTSVADYIALEQKRSPLINCSSPIKRSSPINKLFTFDCSLLDAKIVHETVNNQHKERVCAIAGGSHIERASEVLQKVGYQPIFHLRPTCQSHDIEQCLQLESNQRQTKMPQPISLDRLNNFF